MRADAKKRAPSAEGPARLRSLLVPIDLTAGSDRVLGRILRLPLADDAHVTLLHVVPGGMRPRDVRDATRDAKKVLADEARHLRASLPAKAGLAALVTVGAAAKEIGDFAKKAKAELVVMGRGGARALRDTFLGSTAERVIRRTQLPVLTVRLPARSTYRRPALALDLDEAAHDVVCLTLRMLAPSLPPVAVIHAYDVPYRGLVYPSLSQEDVDEARDELQLAATRKLTELLSKTTAELRIPPESSPFGRLHVRYGSPRLVVPKLAKKLDTDLLVLGTRGRSGAAYALLGTVAGDVLRQATCDVLVVPPAPARRSARASVRKRVED